MKSKMYHNHTHEEKIEEEDEKNNLKKYRTVTYCLRIRILALINKQFLILNYFFNLIFFISFFIFNSEYLYIPPFTFVRFPTYTHLTIYKTHINPSIQ